MNDSIHEMIEYYNNKSPANAQKKFPNGWAQLVNITSFLPTNAPYRQREYHFSTNTSAAPTCKNCNNPVNWFVRETRYLTFCSNRCVIEDGTHNTKRTQTVRDRYGAAHFSQTELFKHKFQNTCNMKYGRPHPATTYTGWGQELIQHSQQHISAEVLALIDDADVLRHHHIIEKLTLSAIAELYGVSLTPIRERFKLFNIPVHRYYQSTGERELFDYVISLVGYNNVEQRNRSVLGGKELDIYVPTLNIAFEFDGLYWHSDTVKTRTHLLEKTQLCAMNNITLIHIFEHEWRDKQQQVKDRVASILKCNTTQINARQCEVNIISNNEKRTFLNDYHLQGDCPSSVNIGIYYNNMLVAVMTFGRPRYSSKYSWELLRLCSKQNTNIVGGASKMFKHFTKIYKPDSVLSYCDLRWSTGKVYNTLGFKYSHTSTPNYWYFKTSGKNFIVKGRICCQKHKLQKQLKWFDPQLSEYQNMVENGYNRVWDCGNGVFVWRNT